MTNSRVIGRLEIIKATLIPARLRGWMEFAALLEELSRDAMIATHKTYKERTRARRGGTLRPGHGTPLWNELARHAAAELRRRGDKTNLARDLGVSRQRLHQLLVERTATPDAERTLLLLVWLAARRDDKARP